MAVMSERTEAELRVAAPAFIEAVTGRPAEQWMVDLLVAVSLRKQNVSAPNPANALQTAPLAEQTASDII